MSDYITDKALDRATKLLQRDKLVLDIKKLEQELALDARRFKWDIFKAIVAAVGVSATLLGAGAGILALVLKWNGVIP